MADHNDTTVDFHRMIGAVASDPAERQDGAIKGVLVRVPPDLHRDLKLLSVLHGTTIQALMLGAIREMVARLKQRG